MRRPDEGLILQPVRVFARPRPKADIIFALVVLKLAGLAEMEPFRLM